MELVQELEDIIDSMQFAIEALGKKIATKQKLDAFKDTDKFHTIRNKIVSIKNRVNQSEIIKAKDFEGSKRKINKKLLEWMKGEPFFNIDDIDEILNDYYFFCKSKKIVRKNKNLILKNLIKLSKTRTKLLKTLIRRLF